MMNLLRFTALLAVASATTAVAQQLFTISGTVVHTGSNQPLQKVRVTITPVQNQAAGVEGQTAPPLSMITAEDGRFVFTRLAAGKYSLQAQGHGFAAQTYQQHEQFSTAIVTGPGLDSEHVVFPLSAGGSISGVVFDSEGDPVSDAQIWLLRRGIHTEVRGSVNTSSKGEFHFSHLTTGSYYVAVHASPWYAQHFNRQQEPANSPSNAATSELDVTYPLTYYGDATDPAAASLIAVTEGAKAPIRITLRAVPSIHVALSGLQSSPENGINANLFQLGPDGVQLFTGVEMNSFNGQFELSGIASGHYFLSLFSTRQGRPEPVATQSIEIQGDTSIDVSNAPKNSLTGHVVFEGTPAPARPLILLTSMTLDQEHALSPKPDGTLESDNGTTAAVGRFLVALVNAPGFYLKSVRTKGAEFSHGVLDIRPGAAVDLSVVAAMGDAQIDGVALKEGNPLGGARILAIPEDAGRFDLVRGDQSDSDGTFTVPNLAPGSYTVIAIENGYDLAYTDAAVVKPYLAQGERVTVPAFGKLKVKVKVTARLP